MGSIDRAMTVRNNVYKVYLAKDDKNLHVWETIEAIFENGSIDLKKRLEDINFIVDNSDLKLESVTKGTFLELEEYILAECQVYNDNVKVIPFSHPLLGHIKNIARRV